MFIFPDRENTVNLPIISDIFLHREFTSNTGKILVLKIKRCTRFVVLFNYNLLAFEENIELRYNQIME